MKFRLFLIAALFAASPVLAQTSYTYPSAGTPPVVLLQCDSSAANCVPTSAANPVPVTGAAVSTGNVAAGAADSGNPVKIGCKYSSTPPTLTDGQRGDGTCDTRSNIKVTLYGADSAQAVSVGTGALADATSNTQAGNISVRASPLVYNGSTWDRLRSTGSLGGLLVGTMGNSVCHISTSTTTTCKSGVGMLHTLSVNNLGTVASTTTVYDNTSGSGTVLAVINTLAGQTSYVYDIAFATGLTLVTTGTVAPDVTVSYR